MGSKVVAVVVVFNGMRNDWIQKCLTGLRSSDKPVDIIVIDNSSSDTSVYFIEENFPEITLIKSQENLGFGKANNIGIKMAYDNGADYIFLVNQDVQIKDDTVDKLLSYYENAKGFGIISPMHLTGDGNNLDYNFSIYLHAASCPNLVSDIYLNGIRNKPYEIDFVNAACWLITRNCIETVGGFDPLFYHYGEDNNYIDRLHFHGLKLGVCPSVQIVHDREQVNSKLYFGTKAIEDRYLLLNSLNPIENSFLAKRLYTASRNFYYYMFTFRFAKAFDNYKTKKELKNFSVKAKCSLKQTSRKGLSFLKF